MTCGKRIGANLNIAVNYLEMDYTVNEQSNTCFYILEIFFDRGLPIDFMNAFGNRLSKEGLSRLQG